MEFGGAGFIQTETCPEQFTKRKLKFYVLFNLGRKVFIISYTFSKTIANVAKKKVLRSTAFQGKVLRGNRPYFLVDGFSTAGTKNGSFTYFWECLDFYTFLL